MIQPDDDIQKIQISLVNAQIQHSFYNINYSNNNFKYQLSELIIITKPVGNYNATSLINVMNSYINRWFWFFNYYFTYYWYIKIYIPKRFIIYTDNTYSIGNILGFELNTTYNSNIGILYAPIPLNILGYKRLEIYT